MIRFGLRLAVAGGREAAARLVMIAAAVALGVGLLLSTLAGTNAVNQQNARNAWLNTGVSAGGPAGTAPLWWLIREDYYHGASIGRVDVAATGANSPVPPGIPRLPGPGEFYVSPAMDRALRSAPPAEFGDRYPGHEVGLIGAEALPSPDSMLIVIGVTAADLSTDPSAVQVTRIMTIDPGRCQNCYVGIPNAGITVILGVVGIALLFPVLMFIGTATRLSASRREQRFAAMRLVGATPRQISVLAAVESTAAAVIGTVVGFGVYLALRPALVRVPFTGDRFYPADIGLTVPDILVVAVGVPVAALVAARLALRRVHISPLGVVRQVTPRPPGAWRLVLLALGLAELAWFVDRRPPTDNGQILAYLTGIFLIMVGLVIAGPWLTMAGARVMAQRARRPETVIAGRRLADNPKAGFRAVSGLMLALFVTSVATGVVTTYVKGRDVPPPGSLAATSMVQYFWPQDLRAGQTAPPPSAVPDTALRAIPGVRSVTVVRANPEPVPVGRDVPPQDGVVGCAELALDPALGRCPAGARVVGVDPGLTPYPFTATVPTWTASDLDPGRLAQLPVISVVVDTDGSASTVNRARTVLELAFPHARFVATDAENRADKTKQFAQWQQLADVVILASLPIAGCSLAVAVVGGLTERKRPFSLLRLTGAPLGVLRRVVVLESVVPLLVVAVVAIGIGFLAAQLFLKSQIRIPLYPPSLSYYLTVAGGLVLSLAIIASTMPLLRRITGPETARNE